MTIIQKVRMIRDEHFHELRTENEKQFIEDMYDGLEGLPSNTIDEDIADYLTDRQIGWIEDIWVYLQ